jgi:DNA-binding NarL/FixJ family response regulator
VQTLPSEQWTSAVLTAVAELSQARVGKTERERIRVLIADEQALFRSGLIQLLEEDQAVKVVGEASDGDEAVRQAGAMKPDLVLLDLNTPKIDGLEAARQIVATNPDVKVLILGMTGSAAHVMEALGSGASGYLLKTSRPEAIKSSIETVLAGQWVMAGSVAKRFHEQTVATNGPVAGHLYDGLTAREIEVVRLLASGLANKQIAFRLKISEKTVGRHISKIYAKLKIRDRSHAVLYAVRKGLVEI